MTVETRTKLLVAVLGVAVLLAGCASLVASDGGDGPEPEEGPSNAGVDADLEDTNASDPASASEATGQPATIDLSDVADAMTSVGTVSFEINQSTALAGHSQSVNLTGAVDTDSGEARLETAVDSPFGAQSWASYIVNGTVYSEVGETWTKADLSGAWNGTLAGGAFAGDTLAGGTSDTVSLDVVGTATFDGNEVYVVEPTVNESALAEAQSAFVENLTAGFDDDNQTLDGRFENIDTEFDWNLSEAWESESGIFDWNASEAWESESSDFDWNISEAWESESSDFDWNISEAWESESSDFDWNLSEEWESEGGIFDWNASEEWESEGGIFDWDASEEWESESGSFDWNLSEAWESESSDFDWNLSEEWESESSDFDWNLSEAWESEGGIFDWNHSSEWESESSGFDWNASEEWESESSDFDWNASEEWNFEGNISVWNGSGEWERGEDTFGDGETDFGGSLVGSESFGGLSAVNTTMYIDTETSRIRYAETTVSVGEGGERGTLSTSTTFENFGGPVEIDLPAEAENAEALWPRS